MDNPTVKIKQEPYVENQFESKAQGPCTSVEYNTEHQHKRIRLEDQFNWVLSNINAVTSPSTSTDEINIKKEPADTSGIQLGINNVNINDDDIKRECESFNLDSPLDSKELLLECEHMYHCVECAYSTAISKELEIHMNDCHIQKCTECEYATLKKSTLNQHRRLKHPTLKKCKECEFSTLKKAALVKHQKTEHRKYRSITKSLEALQKKIEEDSASIPDILKNQSFNTFVTSTTNSSESSTEDIKRINSMDIGNQEANAEKIRRLLPVTRTVGINKVDNLLSNNFVQFSLEKKLVIKNLGPHQPVNFNFNKGDEKQNHLFADDLFRKVDWLTISESKKSFYCFYCLLFGGEVIWSKIGCKDVKNILEKAKLHESTALHINNAVKLKTFGISIKTQNNRERQNLYSCRNELVEKHRNILSKTINCIKFCLTQDIPLPEDENAEFMFNRKVFLGLLEYSSEYDNEISVHISNSSTGILITEAVQNDLIDCMYDIYKDQLKKDLENSNFASVHVERIPSLSLYSRFAIILRYMKEGLPAERLHSFIEVTDKTPSGLALAIHEELAPYNLSSKLITQTYDGSVTVTGLYGGVQSCLKKFYPHALFIHSYAHSFANILRTACFTIQPVKLFFGHISQFAHYFLLPRRVEALQSECNKFPYSIANQWDSEFNIIKTIYHNQHALIACFKKILDEYGWSDECIREANQFSDVLNDSEFLFLLTFFYQLLHHVETLIGQFQARTSYGTIIKALEDFEMKVIDMVDETKQDAFLVFRDVATQICNITNNEMRKRVEASDHTIIFSVLNANECGKIPKEHVKILMSQYRMLECDKLTSELKVLSNNSVFNSVRSPTEFLNFLVANELCTTFSELYKLGEIALVTPTKCISSNDSISTSEKLQKFMKTEWLPEKLHVFATFKIHKDFIDSIHNFNNLVIDFFADKESKREEFLYVA